MNIFINQLDSLLKKEHSIKPLTPLHRTHQIKSDATRTARCYGYENARDTKKGATVKRKPLSKDLYYIIKETTTSLF